MNNYIESHFPECEEQAEDAECICERLRQEAIEQEAESKYE